VSAYRDAADVSVPGLLICAGLDPSGGAGLLADVTVARMLGTRPVGVVTALTTQNTTGVVGSRAMDPVIIRDQLTFLLQDVEVKAVKIGMIGSAEIAASINDGLALTRAPVVWDPILYPSRGNVALADSLLGPSTDVLKPHLALITPNVHELAHLTRTRITSRGEALAAAYQLARTLETAVLVKGGHLGSDESVDILVRDGGMEEIGGPRIPFGEDVHGTGCALATAIAAYLARDEDLSEACRAANMFVADRIARAVQPGRGAKAVV
jgi:hydroxymethylpyrimidine/phosphomethylpyrimidine kinase